MAIDRLIESVTESMHKSERMLLKHDGAREAIGYLHECCVSGSLLAPLLRKKGMEWLFLFFITPTSTFFMSET